ncbi:MAG: transposase [Bacteroidales bacterium]|nr:transposase [Bacteroidales bacterium]
MLNHLHIIWAENKNIRKESAKASFFKFTAHQFLKTLKIEDQSLLKLFLVNKSDRKYQFWQRNTLDIEILSDNMFDQKLNYLHNNPLQMQWQLVNDPIKYRYSSASYYEKNVDEFGILTDYYLA